MKIIKTLLILCAIAVAVQVTASASSFFGKMIKPSGDNITKTFNIPSSSFDKIDVSSSAHVKIVEGSGEIVVKIDSNLVSYLVVKVSDRELIIELNRNSGIRGSFTFEVEVPYDGKLKEISASGASDIESEVVLTGDNIIIRASGASDITVDVDADRCEAKASGASDISLVGKANSVRLNASGASEISVRNLEYQTIEVSKSGASYLRYQKN